MLVGVRLLVLFFVYLGMFSDLVLVGCEVYVFVEFGGVVDVLVVLVDEVVFGMVVLVVGVLCL